MAADRREDERLGAEIIADDVELNSPMMSLAAVCFVGLLCLLDPVSCPSQWSAALCPSWQFDHLAPSAASLFAAHADSAANE